LQRYDTTIFQSLARLHDYLNNHRMPPSSPNDLPGFQELCRLEDHLDEVLYTRWYVKKLIADDGYNIAQVRFDPSPRIKLFSLIAVLFQLTTSQLQEYERVTMGQLQQLTRLGGAQELHRQVYSVLAHLYTKN
jgi:hypothetical protein